MSTQSAVAQVKELLMSWSDRFVMGITVILWMGIFLLGTLVNSGPYRERFAGFTGDPVSVVGDGVIVALTYTLSNVGFLCLLASLLGSIGATADLGIDGATDDQQDTTAPRTSALLRGFLVYLALLAGVLVFAETPANPTQTQYVRLAGVTSLVAFAVNYKPALFAMLFSRLSKVFDK